MCKRATGKFCEHSSESKRDAGKSDVVNWQSIKRDVTLTLCLRSREKLRTAVYDLYS